ncbi:MAG TPA: EAL domain-containing protein [Hyphomicrobium sp.]|nr:EAL domain-containing protein [Hyphomicrobium sp.]
MTFGGWGKSNRTTSWLTAFVVVALSLFGLAARAEALTPIPVQEDQDRIEITTLGEAYEGRGDSLQVETAAGQDGVSGRMTVRASVPGTSPNWMVFSLTNKTDKSLERLLTADRYSIVGSGTVWPDLDARRIESVTPSVGFVPERIKNDKADVFRITMEPGQTITYVAELAGERFSRLYLWKPIDYEIKSRDRQLFNGAMLGLTGLLAIFLTSIFAANHKLIFPAAALVAWTVLNYLCVDFGFFHKLFNLRPEDNAVYRAAGEAAMASSFVIFLSTFLRLGLWHGIVRMMIGVWMVAQLTLIAVAVIDPRLAATFARLSFLMIGGVGGLFTVFLAFKGQDRALSLVPTWLLLLVWIFATGMTLSGRMSGDVVVSSLIAGLVLVVILMGFTVTQFAFRSADAAYAGAPTELQGRSLALAASGSTVWEWNIRRDEIKVSPEVEIALSLMPGELSTKVDDFLRHVHPTDKERFRVMLMSVQERSGVRIRTDFRLRHSDNSWRWFELEAASVPNSDGRTLRCVGLLRDVSDMKRAHERLLHDAVHCSLTGLPNRELFLDRLKGAVVRAKTDTSVKPALVFIDLDKFKSINSSFGLVRGDSLLLTVARRLQRHLGAHDTVARVGGDQFAMLFTGEREARNLAALAERVRRSLRAPIPLANQEVVLTGSMGIAVWDETRAADDDLLKDAELAMYRAKRVGADRIEVFDPGMRRDREQSAGAELSKAIEKGQLRVLYQPIVYLPTKELAGFEAFVRWEHPKLGLVNPASLVDADGASDALIKVNCVLLLRAAKDAAKWISELPRPERPLFVSVNMSCPQLFKPESIQEIRHILGRNTVPPGTLRLEIAENLVMSNPEQAAEVLKVLHASGAELALDEFGTGYSSLAYLNRFPFDTIKISRELVRSNGTAAGAAIVRSMVALAHELSKTVVAEGVERADEATFLRSIGCEYAQGYHFGEPIPERAVLQLLKMVRRSESKMQPRGFFRPKFRSIGKQAKAKVARAAIAAPDKSPATGDQKAITAPPKAPAKVAAALPVGSIVRQRHKSVAAKPPVAAAMPAKSAAPPKAAEALRSAVTNGGPPGNPLAPVVPGAMPALPPELLQNIERTSGSAPQAQRKPSGKGHGQSAPKPSAPGPLPTPVADRTASLSGPNIMAPLSEALARASNTPQTTGRPAPAGTSQRNGHAPPPAKEPPPVNAAPPLPTPNESTQQPDFSTLPPSIAASLARLAGGEPPPKTMGGPPSRSEPKVASKG